MNKAELTAAITAEAGAPPPDGLTNAELETMLNELLAESEGTIDVGLHNGAKISEGEARTLAAQGHKGARIALGLEDAPEDGEPDADEDEAPDGDTQPNTGTDQE